MVGADLAVIQAHPGSLGNQMPPTPGGRVAGVGHGANPIAGADTKAWECRSVPIPRCRSHEHSETPDSQTENGAQSPGTRPALS